MYTIIKSLFRQIYLRILVCHTSLRHLQIRRLPCRDEKIYTITYSINRNNPLLFSLPCFPSTTTCVTGPFRLKLAKTNDYVAKIIINSTHCFFEIMDELILPKSYVSKREWNNKCQISSFFSAIDRQIRIYLGKYRKGSITCSFRGCLFHKSYLELTIRVF